LPGAGYGFDIMKLTFTGFVLCSLFFTGVAGANTLVDGDVDAGQTKATTCGACHGADGNSVNPVWPSLAGQHATYIVDQLQAFRDGTRNDPLMSAQAMSLSDEDMRDLAVYYAAQRSAARAVADASTLNKGRALYVGGDSEAGVSACIACHGPVGRGNPAALYPSLRGQYAAYTAKQLRDYKSGTRATDGTTRMMRNIAESLSEEDIDAVASYIQGLHGTVSAAD